MDASEFLSTPSTNVVLQNKFPVRLFSYQRQKVDEEEQILDKHKGTGRKTRVLVERKGRNFRQQWHIRDKKSCEVVDSDRSR